MREEGVRGFYRGLSASNSGVTETMIQWVLYEQPKRAAAGEGKSIRSGLGCRALPSASACLLRIPSPQLRMVFVVCSPS